MPACRSSSATAAHVRRLYLDSPLPSAISTPTAVGPSIRRMTPSITVTATARSDPRVRQPISLSSISAMVLSERVSMRATIWAMSGESMLASEVSSCGGGAVPAWGRRVITKPLASNRSSNTEAACRAGSVVLTYSRRSRIPVFQV